jgi:hypothetical protein
LKKYKEELGKHKEKIRTQNEDIEEALRLLMLINKEKETTRKIFESEFFPHFIILGFYWLIYLLFFSREAEQK